ncbi:hypothetical protein HOLleu_30023 [Holothuria leucospilota]|uniref:Uncharacterized protein n=1 Tax=Holothuria leucospilota TaxID=206669 RepID=A0A9Q1BJT1_HOLLE|nr:hypothetical protein HOLleu_30023 [Holothuria leucospilota]
MFKMKNQFVGSFEPNSQEDSVPVSLLPLVAMVLNGPNIKARSSSSAMSQPVFTIFQLLMSNSMVRRRENQQTPCTTRHNQGRETPLPIYLGVMTHTKTRKRELVDRLYDLGLSISYDRVLTISAELGDKICHYYTMEKAVCPPELKGGLFTTAADDNIDHNPSSTSAHDSFHGTGISLFQHPNNDCSGSSRAVAHTYRDAAGAKKMSASLPQTYTNVPPVALPRQDPPVPKQEGPNRADCQLIPQAMRWLEHLKQVVDSDTLKEDEMISWAGYHASQQAARPPEDMNVALTSLLPLFHDEAHSVAMIRHSMDIVKTAVDVLNPGQIPVLTCDQPLYTLAKQIQWSWPISYGEDRFIVMFGGLHIEMASLKVLGDLLEGSGWTGALVQAGVATSGTADSFLKASHVTRTRRAHQVTASSLYLLQQSAYREYIQTLEDASEVLPFEDWCDARSDACPQFQFWYFILQLELAVMVYVRAIHCPLVLRLGPYTPYSRWVPIHIRDMVSLKKLNPDVYAEFLKGKFVVKKSKRVFSAVAIDQAHEQNNASVKGDGGAVGLTENPAALRRWMVSGPEMARLIQEFEGSTEKRQDTDIRHHEQKRHAQMAFAQDVRSLSRAMEEMGNPFTEYSSDLLVLDSRDVVDTAEADTVLQMEKVGLEQYETYVEERLVNQTVPITDPIKRNNLHLFSRPPVREKSRKQLQMSSLKDVR